MNLRVIHPCGCIEWMVSYPSVAFDHISVKTKEKHIFILLLQMVWTGERLQCFSDGLAGAKSGRSVQLLLTKIHDENSSNASRSGKILRHTKYIYF